MFVRVKSAVKSDPQHEFDVSVRELETNRGLYTVVDPAPVHDSRPPRYVTRERAKPAPKRKKK